MKYNKEIYGKVVNRIYSTKIKFEKELEVRKSIFYAKFPRAQKIETEIASLSIKTARTVIKGGNVKKELLELKKQNESLKEELKELIYNAGYPEDYLKLKYACKQCKDEGYIDGKMCECMKNLLKQEVYNSVNKVSRLRDSTFSKFSLKYYPNYSVNENEKNAKEHMAKVLEYCKNYAKNFSSNSESLLFRGDTGLGKTHLSLAIANEVINKGYTVIYTSAQNMISEIERMKFNNENLDYSCSFMECDLLILDNLGSEFISDFSSSIISNILDMRISSRKPSIISTTLSVDDIKEKYSPRTCSLIIGSHTQLRFLGHDIRQKLRHGLN